VVLAVRAGSNVNTNSEINSDSATEIKNISTEQLRKKSTLSSHTKTES